MIVRLRRLVFFIWKALIIVFVMILPLGEEGIGFGNVLLQMTGDGKKRYVVLEGRADGGFILPNQISAKDIAGA